MKKIQFRFIISWSLILALTLISIFTCNNLVNAATGNDLNYSSIPAKMLDNMYLDGMKVLGLKVDEAKKDKVLYVYAGKSMYDKYGKKYLTNIPYVATGNVCSARPGYYTVKNIKASAESNGMCCTSINNWLLFNYIPSITGENLYYPVDSLTGNVNGHGNWNIPTDHYRAYEMTIKQADSKVKKLYQATTNINDKNSAGVKVSQWNNNMFNDCTIDSIPIGAAIVYVAKDTNNNWAFSHVAVYAGYVGGKHYIFHCGNSRGPEISTIDSMETLAGDGKTGEYVYAIYGVPEAKINIALNKSIDNIEILDLNTYSLEGAEYNIYYSKSSITTSIVGGIQVPKGSLGTDYYLVGTFVTNSTGKGLVKAVNSFLGNTPGISSNKEEITNLPYGYYIAIENKAPDGLIIDTNSSAVNLNSSLSTKTCTFNCKDNSMYDPFGIAIVKKDLNNLTSNEHSLEGTIIEYCYYDGYYNKSNIPSLPTRKWYFKFKFHEDYNACASLLMSEYLADGYESDPLFLDKAGHGMIPNGTVTIREVKAAEGYEINSGQVIDFSGQIYEDRIFIGQVKYDPQAATFASMYISPDGVEFNKKSDNPVLNITNSKPINITTSAKDSVSLANNGFIKSEISIIDDVEISNLTLNKSYKISGKLINKSTGNPFKIDGKEIIAESPVFKADSSNKTITLTFTFNPVKAGVISFNNNSFTINDVVVFEKLIDVASNEVVATEEDISNSNQSVHYEYDQPKVRIDKKAQNEQLLEGAKLSILDNSGKTIKEFTSTLSTFESSINPGLYKLVEIDAPKHFNLASAIEFEVTLDGKVIVNNKAVNVIDMFDNNNFNPELPSVGGPGIIILIIIGSALFISALILTIYANRKEENHEI